ncbi:sugar ABC transporter substrate-binding protein [Pleomorphomonas sp. JP5]|uniref:ABC transporter substrate-binding protein n=1 Tax=Pleomorphomonas sp. JP5 TaxID=2942998 RepID=UPI00204304BC|nr:sugar ABC transporter substrate-binding protein [Pleomorphomonas sp. JP5]MCM5557203.1 sugar ABC transporter substrate-binding protein [Pleomorphomonas sp. JP5]
MSYNCIRTIALATVFGALSASVATAGPVCKSDVRILAQPRDALTMLEEQKADFKTLSGVDFEIDYLNEGDRRAKSQADASTTGRYNVYYVDEANLALFASSGWLVPLLDHYPAEFDFDDFDDGRKTTATYDGKIWFAPIQGGGDIMVYRKDLLEAAGIKPPTTLDELRAAVPKLTDPAKGVYGIALRGKRGSGDNVWRWMPYFKAEGGQWFDNGKPAFDSQAAVDATNIYLDLFKYSSPGTQTGSWDEATGAFLSGQVAIIIESAPLAAITIDPAKSSVTDKVAFLPPPSPMPGGGFAHGFAIGAKGNPDKEARDCAGLFVAWATSKEVEMKRLEAGDVGEVNRKSIVESALFSEKYGTALPEALAATAPKTAVNFWQNAHWPELGNKWGILLEELITGQRTDVKGALDELDEFAKQFASD